MNVPEEHRWCYLRGLEVAEQECVNACPAPEALAQCLADIHRRKAAADEKEIADRTARLIAMQSGTYKADD